MSWKKISEMPISGKTVLVRVDVNVPMQDGRVSDFSRIDRIAPTIRAILAEGGRPVLLAHFGRPKGAVVPEMSLAPIAAEMGAHLNLDIQFSPETVGQVARDAISALPAGSVLMLENTRFLVGEEKNDPEVAKAMADLGDIYCNDAFSAAHRAHASTTGVAEYLPSCAGLLMEAELSALEAALTAPQKPVAAVVGGAKISTKLDLLSNMIAKTDYIIIGGGMANTFLAAQGINVGKSLCEHDLLDTARDIMAKAATQKCEIILPVDIVTAREFKAGAASEIHAADACPADAMILDAGPATIDKINAVFDASKTLVWNGPLGAFEIEPFNIATDACARHAAQLTIDGKLLSVAGGGDTVAALNSTGSSDKFHYISTAGGAFLEWLEGKELPGVAALNS